MNEAGEVEVKLSAETTEKALRTLGSADHALTMSLRQSAGEWNGHPFVTICFPARFFVSAPATLNA